VSSLEKLFLYGGILYLFLGIILPITIFYWINKGRQQLIECTKVEKKAKQLKLNDNQNYIKVKRLFNQSIKSGKLTREQLLSFKDILNTLLGKNLNHYTKFVFKNDCHEIYIKLKNSSLSELDYIQMYQYLNKLIKN
jgi:hypothetical protein